MDETRDAPAPEPAIDPAVAAQLDAADTRESPGEGRGHDASGPDEMSRVIEEDAERRSGDDGGPAHPDSLADGAEW